MLQRFLDPKVLLNISGLELTAKTVVDGFISGLHRSPDFGFSQEFAEYRPYSPGDDLRSVDWNVFGRTERLFLKRYRGETNTRLTLLLDRSASMSYGSEGVRKIDYARFLCASLAYMAAGQRDASGLITFDDDVRDFVKPSSRQGQLQRILHAVDRSEPGQRTDFSKPFFKFLESIHWRGIVVVISDFYADPTEIVKTIAPLRFHGNEVVLFHLLDPGELRPPLTEPKILIDLETQDSIEVSPAWVDSVYRVKIDHHIDQLKTESRSAGLDYHLVSTARPLDEALREYLVIRQGRM